MRGGRSPLRVPVDPRPLPSGGDALEVQIISVLAVGVATRARFGLIARKRRPALNPAGSESLFNDYLGKVQSLSLEKQPDPSTGSVHGARARREPPPGRIRQDPVTLNPAM